MPFKSEAQRRKFYAMAADGEISQKTLKKWEDETPKGKKLPKKLKKTAATKQQIHRLADKLNIPWDSDPKFMRFTKKLTGKSCLDKMNKGELSRVHAALKKRGKQKEANIANYFKAKNLLRAGKESAQNIRGTLISPKAVSVYSNPRFANVLESLATGTPTTGLIVREGSRAAASGIASAMRRLKQVPALKGKKEWQQTADMLKGPTKTKLSSDESFWEAKRKHTLVKTARLRGYETPKQELTKKAQSAVYVNGVPLQVEVADNPHAHDKGLMGRMSLGENSGMLFKFAEEQNLSFWMKDTHIPLSIAFMDKEGVIGSIKDMTPGSLDLVKSAGPALFALEAPRGWFDRNEVRPGHKVTGIEKLSFRLTPDTLAHKTNPGQSQEYKPSVVHQVKPAKTTRIRKMFAKKNKAPKQPKLQQYAAQSPVFQKSAGLASSFSSHFTRPFKYPLKGPGPAKTSLRFLKKQPTLQQYSPSSFMPKPPKTASVLSPLIDLKKKQYAAHSASVKKRVGVLKKSLAPPTLKTPAGVAKMASPKEVLKRVGKWYIPPKPKTVDEGIVTALSGVVPGGLIPLNLPRTYPMGKKGVKDAIDFLAKGRTVKPPPDVAEALAKIDANNALKKATKIRTMKPEVAKGSNVYSPEFISKHGYAQFFELMLRAKERPRLQKIAKEVEEKRSVMGHAKNCRYTRTGRSVVRPYKRRKRGSKTQLKVS